MTTTASFRTYTVSDEWSQNTLRVPRKPARVLISNTCISVFTTRREAACALLIARRLNKRIVRGES